MLRWRPRPHAQRGSLTLAGSPDALASPPAQLAERTTPRVRPSGAAAHLDIFERPASFSDPRFAVLAIARILRTGARLLLLDEPTEGLAPVIVQQIGATIGRLKTDGFTILLVEQNFRFAATVADRHYVMEHGRVADMIRNDEIDRHMDKLHDYLGV